jgi:two-component system, OmpR family, response regulator
MVARAALAEARNDAPPVTTARLLLVDDDREIRELVSHFLEKYGYLVETVRDGREMSVALARHDVDLVILDIMLPGKDGLQLCREIRERSHVPILMLTAMGEETDRIVGLEMGADDYLAKPFSPRELLARVRALLRRVNFLKVQPGAKPAGRVLHFAGWTLDLARRRLTAPDGMLVGLTSGEFEMLVAFTEHPHQVLSRDQLLDLTRGRDSSPFDRSVDVQVSRLRRKIEPDPKVPSLIVTVRSGGYVFTPNIDSR